MDPITIIFVAAAIATVIGSLIAAADYVRKRISETPKEKPTTPMALVRKHAVITIGVTNFRPFTSFDRDHSETQFGGIHIEILREISAKTGVEIRFVTTRASQIFPQILNGQVEGVTSLLESPARARVGRFAFKRFGVPVVGIVRKDHSRVWHADDLRDQQTRFVVIAGEVGEEIATDRYDAKPGNGRLIVVDTEDVPSIISQVELGNADTALTVGPRWLQHVKRWGPQCTEKVGLIFDNHPLLVAPCGLMVRSNQMEFVSWLDEAANFYWDQPKFKQFRNEIYKAVEWEASAQVGRSSA